MPSYHPAISLLLISGLVIFWLIPVSSWLMLRGQRDALANLWFTGTALYSVVVTLFVFAPVLHPWISGSFSATCVFAAVLIMLESLRRETSSTPTPLRWYFVSVASFCALMTWSWLEGLFDSYGRGFFYLLIALTECILIVQANRARRHHHSQSLWILIVTFVIFTATNVARVVEWWIQGRYPPLLEFTPVGSFTVTVNYLSAIFYCYGYWGFVVEKNRKQMRIAIEQAVIARESEKMVREREAHMEETLRERNELMSRLAMVSKHAQSGALSASIAHELNQPLAAIQLNIQESERLARETNAPAHLQSLLDRIKLDNQRATNTVRRVRDMFRQDPMPKKDQQLDPLVEWLLNWMEKQLEREKVQLHLTLNAPHPIPFAAGEIEHILMNLIDNALDALLQVPPSERRLTISTWEEAEWVCLSVADNGPGVPANLAHNLFELTKTSKPDGLGLGLWLARYLAERNGGKIYLKSSSASGSCFELRLPAA